MMKMKTKTAIGDALERAGYRHPLQIAEEARERALSAANGDYDAAFTALRAELCTLNGDVTLAVFDERTVYRTLMDFLGELAAAKRAEAKKAATAPQATGADNVVPMPARQPPRDGTGQSQSDTQVESARPVNKSPTKGQIAAMIAVENRFANTIMMTMLVNGQPLHKTTKRELIESARSDTRNARFKLRIAEGITLDHQTPADCWDVYAVQAEYDRIAAALDGAVT